MPRSNDDASRQGLFGGHGAGIALGLGAGAIGNIAQGVMINNNIAKSPEGHAAAKALQQKILSGDIGVKDAISQRMNIAREHGGKLGKLHAGKYGKFMGVGTLAAGALIGGMLDRD